MQEVPSTSSAAANPFAAIRAVVEPAALPAGRKPGSPRQSEVRMQPRVTMCRFCMRQSSPFGAWERLSHAGCIRGFLVLRRTSLADVLLLIEYAMRNGFFRRLS